MATVHHSGEGTTVTDTTRDQADVLKAHGFRWSSRQQFWFLPRTWHETTRRRRAEELAKALPAELDLGDVNVHSTAEERAEAIKARAAELADVHAERAGRHADAADRHYAASDAAVEGIPFGQPILVGHHSQRRHEKAMDKSWAQLGKGVAESAEATREAERAAAAARRAEGYDRPDVVGRRLETRKAELRKVLRFLDGRDPANDNVHVASMRALADQLAQDVDRDQAVLEAAGVLSAAVVRPGDMVRIRNTWYVVERSSPKTVTVTGWNYQGRHLYTEIADHVHAPAEEKVLELLRTRHPNDLRDTLRLSRLPASVRALHEKALDV